MGVTSTGDPDRSVQSIVMGPLPKDPESTHTKLFPWLLSLSLQSQGSYLKTSVSIGPSNEHFSLGHVSSSHGLPSVVTQSIVTSMSQATGGGVGLGVGLIVLGGLVGPEKQKW